MAMRIESSLGEKKSAFFPEGNLSNWEREEQEPWPAESTAYEALG